MRPKVSKTKRYTGHCSPFGKDIKMRIVHKYLVFKMMPTWDGPIALRFDGQVVVALSVVGFDGEGEFSLERVGDSHIFSGSNAQGIPMRIDLKDKLMIYNGGGPHPFEIQD